ncbi:hypothetical protein GCM10011507_05480 [Edaphobacter acidisoli]|uniref:Uncharacterized protein n=1 Tax=Edaphobacter acidisoli TaxID=2040573 RepID=A0A916W037_9BACT|nr:hypothetical protein [Edaphobacter acidisoli]GGA57031.1 hypothetical protein GCM10011507_05480 [Edaphobacter acidisoli]
MTLFRSTHSRLQSLTTCLAVFTLGAAVAATPCIAQQDRDHGHGNDHDHSMHFHPGNLVVSRSVYDNNAANVTVGEPLPSNCAQTVGPCAPAVNNGLYPQVFNNDTVDGSFGITSKIFLDQITPNGFLIDSLEVPNSSQKHVQENSDQLVTSFSSKSELALNLSTDHRFLTFMGYVAPINTLDVSNSNTPGVIDPTNPVGINIYRAVATVDRNGRFTFTETNAYNGNNGRAAIYNDTNGANVFYTAGNAGNGSNPQPAGVVLGAGTQFIEPANAPESFQTPATPTPLASFSITLLGDKADKIGKDDNFRGLTVFNNVVYLTKGSGSNGVNTVYFVDTTGTACPKGVGVPAPGATLPIAPLTYDPSTLAKSGLPSNMCILAGFPTTPAKTANPAAYPFGLWFANANTLYVADEGDGYAGGTDLYTHAAAETTAGIQKWVFNSSTQTWNYVYTLQANLKLGVPYTIDNYPTGINSATNLPWAPAADGIRNITGTVDCDGRVTLYGITSTVSGSGDQGADPNRLVAVTDNLSNTDATVAAKEEFHSIRKAGFGEVLRGVSFAPDAK